MSLLSTKNETVPNFSTLYLGTFNSEQYWRNSEFSVLPSYEDSETTAIVSTMDELFFVFCTNPKDQLLTRIPMDPAHLDYLRLLGYNISNNQLPIDDSISNENSIPTSSVCSLLVCSKHKLYFNQMIKQVSCVSPYSILPSYSIFCRDYNIEGQIPSLESVRRVNSKIYSHKLRTCLCDYSVGQIVKSANEMNSVGHRLLSQSPFLIKDAYSVSGKGILLVEKESILSRIVAYLIRQEKQGRQTQFLLEPLLNKFLDFSCQFEIHQSGDMSILSIHQMDNTDFSFSEIHPASTHLQFKLEDQGYFTLIDTIAKQIYEDGYFGHICLDSMILNDGTIIPIVEINARKSMGLISYYLNRYLSQFSTTGKLITIDMVFSKKFTFHELLHRIKKLKILFEPNYPYGFLPLSANTLQINNRNHDINKGDGRFRGRLYSTIVARVPQDYRYIQNAFKNELTKLGAIILRGL